MVVLVLVLLVLLVLVLVLLMLLTADGAHAVVPSIRQPHAERRD